MSAPRFDPGGLFVVSGRIYVDSQTLHNVAAMAPVLPAAGGYHVLVPTGGTLHCAAVEGRPALVGQRGSLYELSAANGTKASKVCETWLSSQATKLSGKYSTWPGATCGGCGKTCGCAPCRRRHGHDHDHAHDHHDHEEDAL